MTELEAMEFETQVRILCLLAEIQQKSGPVEVSIGWIQDGALQQGIVIKSAPPFVAQKLAEAGCCMEIMPQGVRVYEAQLND